MEVPAIDLGEMMFCKDTHQKGFDSTKVNAIEVNNDNKESDKDSEGNSMEKMLKKNIRKFVPKESDQKASDSNSVAKTPDSGKSNIEGEKLDDNFWLYNQIYWTKKGAEMVTMKQIWKDQLENLQIR